MKILQTIATRNAASGNSVYSHTAYFRHSKVRPAGAMSTINWRGELQDREWQSSVLQIIYKSKVPVIPIYFHGSNSWMFNFLGKVCWPLRSLRLPAEVFKKIGKEIHVSIGEAISVEEQVAHGTSAEELGKYLREKTYELRERYKK